MAWIAVAVAGGAALNYYGSQQASNNAADAQRDAANTASQTQLSMYNQNRQDLAPYRQAGQTALGQLQGEMPELTKQFTLSDFKADPGYQFNLDQGNLAINRAAAARGLSGSSGTMKSLADYSQGLADNQFQNAYNRFTQTQQNRYNSLAGVANYGMGATNTGVNAGMNAANNISANTIGAGNASAANSIAGANNLNSLVGGLNNGMLTYSLMNRAPVSTTGLDPNGTVSNPQTFSYENSGYGGGTGVDVSNTV